METDLYFKQFFTKKNETLEENFILFHKFDMTIGSHDNMDYDLYYFIIKDPSTVNNGFCNVDIMGQRNNEFIGTRLATFFKRSDTTFGLVEILENEVYLSKMKLKLNFDYRLSPNRWRMSIEVYIDKQFLLSLYEQEKLPRFLFKIVKENTVNLEKQNAYNYKSISEASTLYASHVTKQYKRELFTYQKMNLNWMIEQENKIDMNTQIQTYKLPTTCYIYNVKSINENIIADTDGKVINLDEQEQVNISIKGGILSDEIGLGKTFSMLSLIVEQLNKTPERTTLLLCPSRLCKQWIEEIEKTYDLKYKLISNIRQYKKLTENDYKNYDIVILSYNFLANKNYLEYCSLNPSNPILLHNYKWNRAILDEGHEYIKYSKNGQSIIINEALHNMKSNYRWICSGTPFGNISNFTNILNYVSDLNFNRLLEHKYDMLINTFFRKNTKESVKQQVIIPDPIITTEFLNMSQLERIIYDSALNDKNKQLELCNHIMVSEDHILGSKPLTLEEIKEKMTEYYKKKVDTYTKRISNLQTAIEESTQNNNITEINEQTVKLEEYKVLLQTYTSKFNIFSQIEDKFGDNETCPICIEELKDLTNCITPCGHVFCSTCLNASQQHSNSCKNKCPMCRCEFKLDEVKCIKPNNTDENNSEPKLGTKIEHLINTVKTIINNNNKDKIIVFSQWDNMLKLIAKIFTEYNINFIVVNGSIHTVTSKIRKFKLDDTINVVLMSSDKSPSGLNLTEASHIILMDSLNTSKENALIIEQQAIGRAVRIGQTRQVNVKRFIMRNTIEHDYYIRNIET